MRQREDQVLTFYYVCVFHRQAQSVGPPMGSVFQPQPVTFGLLPNLRKEYRKPKDIQKVKTASEKEKRQISQNIAQGITTGVPAGKNGIAGIEKLLDNATAPQRHVKKQKIAPGSCEGGQRSMQHVECIRKVEDAFTRVSLHAFARHLFGKFFLQHWKTMIGCSMR